VPVHVFQRLLIELQAHRAEVDGLTADHAGRACSHGQGGDHAQADLGIALLSAGRAGR
jgi:hypothetical protein